MRQSTIFAALLAPLVVFAAPAEHLETRQAAAGSVDAKLKTHGKKYFGTATDQNRLTTRNTAAVIQADFGQVTPENSMKWDAIERKLLLDMFTGIY
jgi:endo-1,4-beta-xylanase